MMKRSSSNSKWSRHMALAALPIRYFPSIIHVQVSPVTYGDTPSRQQDFSMTHYVPNVPNSLFTRIIGKISALAVSQYVNYINNKPMGRIKYALN